jgi:hypothetical protein
VAAATVKLRTGYTIAPITADGWDRPWLRDLLFWVVCAEAGAVAALGLLR